MKLLEQISLWCHDGKHDKVYEIDLCEVGTDKHVVNFRYGRRGANLKDGTKTTLALPLDEARKVLNALIAEKQKGGYQKTAHYVASAAPAADSPSINFSALKNTQSKTDYVLSCLADALSPNPTALSAKWSLSRIVWRIGELKINVAAPLLYPLISKGDAMLHYCTCWALGRCGDINAIPFLTQVMNAAATSDKVKRIALCAILALEKEENKRNLLINNLLQPFSSILQTAIQEASEQDIVHLLLSSIIEKQDYQQLENLYLLSDDFPNLHAALLQILHHVKIEPNGFRYLRHLYKIAEFREDAPVFAILTKKMESATAYFRFNRWDKSYDIFVASLNRRFSNPLAEIQKADSKLAFSEATKSYMGRRAWRTLRTLGKDNQNAYVHFAASLLLNYSDADYTAPKTVTGGRYFYDNVTRNYSYVSTTKNYDAFAKYLIFNHILYENSPRYCLKKGATQWQCVENYKPGEAAPTAREEAFSSLWDSNPQVLINLLVKSQCEPVQNFAVKALKERDDLKSLIDVATLLQILAKPYVSTTDLGMEMARQYYDAAAPNVNLVLALLQHPLQAARDLAKAWVAAQTAFFYNETMIFADLILNPYQDISTWIQPILSQFSANEERAKLLISRVIVNLFELKNTNQEQQKAAFAAATLSNYFMSYLSRIELAVPEALLQSENPEVQTFGALILLHHQIAAENLPQSLLANLIQSPTKQVREIGVRLFGKLPEAMLLDSYEIIAAFCVSPHSEIRGAIADTVQRLCAKNHAFGSKLSAELLPYMQRKESHEGLHADLYLLFESALLQNLQQVDNELVLSFLHGGRTIPQQLGLLILKTFTDKNTLSIRQWIRLANHESLDIRTYLWQVFEENVVRTRTESAESLRLLDAKWDDSRAFAIAYFKKYFNENQWTSELIISVCDSTRKDIQVLGKELIMKYFKPEEGEQYLMQLSQHPSQAVQNFTTFFLEEFATQNVQNIQHLEPYFVTVLSQVNKSGVAKRKIFSFLREEALKNQEVATLVARIMTRQSVTMAVADKASCIAVMRDMKVQFPNIEVAIS
jgi:predicted DNA-binding WGR domain protein